MKDMGHDVTRMGYEQIKASIPHVRLAPSQHFQIQMMIESAYDLLPELARRVWSIAISPSGNFICSDRPVAIAFTTPPPWKSYPGFCVPNTQIIVPLSRKIIL